MKKITIITILAIILFASCKKNDSVTYTTHDLWVLGYKTLAPDLEKEKCSTLFLFFDDTNHPDFLTKSYRAEEVMEFQNAKDSIYLMLRDLKKITLTNGDTITPVASIFASCLDDIKTVTIPIGNYFVVAVSMDAELFSRYRKKYCTKHIEVKEAISRQTLFPVFPCDYTRYGEIPWTSWHEEFTYDWVLK